MYDMLNKKVANAATVHVFATMYIVPLYVTSFLLKVLLPLIQFLILEVLCFLRNCSQSMV